MKSDKTLKGMFYSGNHSEEPWIAKKNLNYELPNPDSLTFLKPGYKSLRFSFPGLGRDSVKYPAISNKKRVTIVQILGSWCPNCMDETSFLSRLYRTRHTRGLEIIGLAYEKTADTAQIRKNLSRLIKRFDVQYPIAVAGKTNNKEEAAKTLPMLNHILSFPTTIVLDKSGRVRKIHTGYLGPATGIYYDRFVGSFTDFIDKLLDE